MPGKTCQLQQILERPEWVAGEFPTRGLSLGLSLGPEGTHSLRHQAGLLGSPFQARPASPQLIPLLGS